MPPAPMANGSPTPASFAFRMMFDSRKNSIQRQPSWRARAFSHLSSLASAPPHFFIGTGIVQSSLLITSWIVQIADEVKHQPRNFIKNRRIGNYVAEIIRMTDVLSEGPPSETADRRPRFDAVSDRVCDATRNRSLPGVLVGLAVRRTKAAREQGLRLENVKSTVNIRYERHSLEPWHIQLRCNFIHHRIGIAKCNDHTGLGPPHFCFKSFQI